MSPSNKTQHWLRHRSPGITSIYNEVKTSHKNRILDLGSSSGASFNFFSQLSCNIYFENLSDFFSSNPIEALSKTEVIARLEDYLSDFDQQEKFDVILTWDIFDYLDLNVVQWLIQRLSAYFSPNALIYSIRSVSKHITKKPKSFQITDQYHINIGTSESTFERTYPCHHTAKLLKFLPDFYMESSYLNYEGMIPSLAEMVMRYQPDKKRVTRTQSSDELAQNQHYDETQKQYTKSPHRSYALEPLLRNMTPQAVVLDLGLKNKNNYDFYYEYTHNLYAVNFLSTLNVQQNYDALGQLKRHILSFPEDLKFDVILCWDILNFLEPKMISELFSRLDFHITTSTEIHAVVYSGNTKPKQAQQFQIRSNNQLDIFTAPRVESASTLNSSDLLKAIKTFQLRDTYVFREGMQRGIYEYILTRTS